MHMNTKPKSQKEFRDSREQAASVGTEYWPVDEYFNLVDRVQINLTTTLAGSYGRTGKFLVHQQLDDALEF